MNKNAEKLTKNYYFSSPDLPVSIRQVHGTNASHAYNFTGIPHYHDFAELVIITGGYGEQMIDDKRYPVRAGDVFVILDETVHSFPDYESLKITNVMFDRKLLTREERLLAHIPGYQVLFNLEPELRRTGREFSHKHHLSTALLAQVMELLQRIENEQRLQMPGFEAAVYADFIHLVILLSRSLDNNETPSDTVIQLGNLLSALSVDYASPWTLQKMAKLCSMSVNTLLRHFQLTMNKSPMQYLTSLRLEHACSLLLNTNKSISQIAAECGFSDSNYFAKKFRAVFGVAASDFRRKGTR